MLAQNFKTNADLGISEIEFVALTKVLGMLERGEITDNFQMSAISRKFECGAAYCIQGWCQHLTDHKAFPTHGDKPDRVWTLFMYGDSRRNKVTAPQAAIALRNFLTHGEAIWSEAMAS